MLTEAFEAKRKAAQDLSQAYVDSLFSEKAFEDKLDRGTAVCAAVVRYIVRERIVEEADSYLLFMLELIRRSIDGIFDERGGETCH